MVGGMRGADTKQSSMLCLLSPEDRVPATHPLRPLKALADEALKALSPVFDQMYSDVGRPSVPPERQLKASLLIALYSVRSERQFCEQLDYNLLFRWFLDMSMIEASFDASSFSKNRPRLLEHEVAKRFFAQVVEQARAANLMSSDHFTVDGTLIEAWASHKSFRPKDQADGDRQPPDDPGNPTVNFHGEKRSNETHSSTTDPEARLARKSSNTAARLSYSQHALMENRNGLLVDLRIAEANGRAERAVALAMLDELMPRSRRVTVGADKGYDTRDFVDECRAMNVTPHVAQNCTGRRSAVDERTTRHPGYTTSQRIRKRVEEIFGWTKTVGNFRRTRYRGQARTEQASYLVGAAYNLLRMSRLAPLPA
jgi:transposase